MTLSSLLGTIELGPKQRNDASKGHKSTFTVPAAGPRARWAPQSLWIWLCLARGPYGRVAGNWLWPIAAVTAERAWAGQFVSGERRGRGTRDTSAAPPALEF